MVRKHCHCDGGNAAVHSQQLAATRSRHLHAFGGNRWQPGRHVRCPEADTLSSVTKSFNCGDAAVAGRDGETGQGCHTFVWRGEAASRGGGGASIVEDDETARNVGDFVLEGSDAGVPVGG